MVQAGSGAAARWWAPRHTRTATPEGQIDRVFDIYAREFDIDMRHAPPISQPDMRRPWTWTTCATAHTNGYGYGGRVAIGHVTKLSALAAGAVAGSRPVGWLQAGVAVTVLPATDLYLMGRHQEHSIMRGVTAGPPATLDEGVNCSLGTTNNVLNPFTPFGRLLPGPHGQPGYANICQVRRPPKTMDTNWWARLMAPKFPRRARPDAAARLRARKP